MNNGYISLHRSIFDNWVWKDTPFSYGQAWIDLLLLANYEDGKMLYRDKLIETKRGCVYRSISWLANRWKWSRNKTRHFLGLLESDSMITIESTTQGTTITIVKYGFFQGRGTTQGTTESTTESTTSETTRGQRKDISNKDNKDNKLNNSIGRFTPPALADVQSYFKEKGISDPKEPEKFIDFYTSKGWMVGKNKMKDWKAAVRNWIKGIDKTKVKQNGFNSFENQREYDNDELERLLVANQ